MIDYKLSELPPEVLNLILETLEDKMKSAALEVSFYVSLIEDAEEPSAYLFEKHEESQKKLEDIAQAVTAFRTTVNNLKVMYN